MTIRIGSAQGYYGDNVLSALPMIVGEHVDVVCFEALAELTLTILQKDKLKDPQRGYTFDIGIIANKILPEAYQRKIPLITNGGGLNPLAAAEMVYETAQKVGLNGIKIAAVTGDDVSNRLYELSASNEGLRHLETDEPLDIANNEIINANVYMGAEPIVRALREGADIVITGRVADPCLYLAPMIAKYDWDWQDWNRIASGIVAGHLLECTGQVVGGNSLGTMGQITDGDQINLGYPIVHMERNGDFILTKTPDLPGIVNINTVKEQILYEIHDPANYITPDVIADITQVQLEEVGKDQVRVRDVKGKPRPEKLKMNLGIHEGYKRELLFSVGWPQAWDKFEQIKAMIEKAWADLPIDRIDYSFPGINSLYGSVVDIPDDPMELMIRVNFTAKDTTTLKTATRRMMQNFLTGAPGMNIYGKTIGASPVTILGLWPTLVNRDDIEPEIHYFEGERVMA